MTQQTATLAKTFSNAEFDDFLRSEQQSIRVPDKGSFSTLIKIDSGFKERQFTYIAIEIYSKPVLKTNLDRLDVIGIYDVEADEFYIKQLYTIEWHLESIDRTKYKDYYSQKDDFRKALKRIVFFEIDQQKAQILNSYYEDVLCDFQKERIQQEARGFLLENKPFEVTVPIRLFDNEETPELFFRLLMNEEVELLLAFEQLFVDEQISIHYFVCAEKYFQTCCQQLLSDSKFLNQQRLYKAVKAKDMKSFTVHYKENEKEMIFKIENKINWQSTYLRSWDIQSPKLREQFENEFSDDINFDSIEAITYARKVIYQKEN